MNWISKLLKKDDHQDQNSSYLDREITSSSPKYVIASTCYKLEETIVFEADEQGNRSSPDDYGCIAKRLGHVKMWAIRDIAVRHLLRDNRYGILKEFEEVDGCIQTLYERFDPDVTPEELAQSMAIRNEGFFVC